MPTERELVMDAADMVKDIPAEDVLTPLQLDEENLTPYPEVEYKVIEATSMDKIVRDVNSHLQNGRQTEGGIVVVNGPVSKFYQAMIRWVARGEGVNLGNNIAETEMPSQNSEDGTMGPKPLYIPGLENEPDLYEDVEEDATNG